MIWHRLRCCGKNTGADSNVISGIYDLLNITEETLVALTTCYCGYLRVMACWLSWSPEPQDLSRAVSSGLSSSTIGPILMDMIPRFLDHCLRLPTKIVWRSNSSVFLFSSHSVFLFSLNYVIREITHTQKINYIRQLQMIKLKVLMHE